MSSKPVFSVVVPTRDRHAGLERCLESLASLTFPRGEYEVIVVDDGGRDAPAALVDRYSSAMCTKFLHIAHSGPAAARNAGVAASSGENLAFIDDDCAADPSWLAAMEARLKTHSRAAIGGRVVNALGSNRYARASQNLQEFLYRWYHDERRGELRFFTTNNLAVSRRDFDAIGAFDSSFPFASEDRDWCDRALFSGHDLVYAPEALVRHSHDLAFGTFIRQHYRYGQGAARFHATRAKRRGARIRLEPLSFYGGMLAAPLVTGVPAPLVESLLLIASQSASLVGFARELAVSGN